MNKYEVSQDNTYIVIKPEDILVALNDREQSELNKNEIYNL